MTPELHVTITDIHNVSQIPALYAILPDLQERQLTDTLGFNFDFEHYKQKLHLPIVFAQDTTFFSSGKPNLDPSRFTSNNVQTSEKVQVSV